MWSIGNEIPGASTATATKLIKWVKAIDSTRPLTWACNTWAERSIKGGSRVARSAGIQLRRRRKTDTGSRRPSRRRPQGAPDLEDLRQRESRNVRSRGFYSTRRQSRTGPDARLTKECSDYPDTDASPGFYEQMYLINHEVALGSPASSTGPASTTGASRGRTRRVARQELLFRHRRHGRLPQEHLLLLPEQADDRAHGPHLPALELDVRNEGECLGLQQLRQRGAVPQ
jgi:hypothetical protein